MSSASPWDGCVNVRDLGGHPTEDGRTTRLRRVLRSDDLWHLTPAGRAAFARDGVARVVDLRTDAERLERAGDPGVEVVHVPLLGAWDESGQARHDRRRDEAVDALAYLEWAYREFLERHAERFAAALAAVAEAPVDGPVVVHCVAGKDRTGLVSALLLRLAGVAVDDVAADDAASEACLAPRHDAWVEAAADPLEARRRQMMLHTPREAMARTMARRERSHGDAARYLAEAGLPRDAVERVRRRLLDD